MHGCEHTPQLRWEVTPFIAGTELVTLVIDKRAATRRDHNRVIHAIGWGSPWSATWAASKKKRNHLRALLFLTVQKHEYQ
jgi:hypothetical protein